jgi:hypothetical protein
MTDTTDRFALPLLAAGQAQKELFHNEALALIDALVQPAVESVGADVPPAAPVAGQCWIVGSAPTGAFAGSAGALACWTSGGWRFAAARPGMAVWSLADAAVARCDGTGWTVARRQPAIADPAAGTLVDTEARDAIRAIFATLRTRNIIAA